jgi:DNA polymerase-3 subunit alpha
MLDGMAKIEELIVKAKDLGQKGIVITDHGSSSGLYEAWKLGLKHDFNVCLGEEFYFENTASELKTGHLILIAKNDVGLANLFRLQKLAYDNVYYKPRINMEMLKEHHEGLVCTTACIANAIGQYILKDENVLALNHLLELKNIFGEDLYLEFQSATNEDVIYVNKKLEEIADVNNVNCILTTDVHYLNKEDFSVHEVLLCIQQKAKMSSNKRWKFEHNDYWLKSEAEMLQYVSYLKPETINKCMDGIHDLFEKCKGVNFTIEDHLPKFCETKQEEDEMLKKVTYEGLFKKIKERNEITTQFVNDIDKELRVISEEGYSGYFLTVREYCKWARDNNIPVGDGRGSGAGSKVAYTIDITDVNPEKYDLLFERFMAHNRTPDFDCDFSDIDAVFKHLQEKYGEENVARVGAYTKFTAKSATIKVLSAFGYTTREVKNITALMPDRLEFTFEEALKENKELDKFFKENQELKHIIQKFEGITEHASTHAGGVIICKGLTYMLPIIKRSDDKDKMIIALDKKALEELGHYKFDILGLSSLTMMQNIKDFVNVDWNKIDFDKPEVYEMLQKGEVTGVFQLSEQKDKTIEMKPNCFNDLIAINALIRPGVCDWNDYLNERFNKSEDKTNTIYKHLPFMKETHGLIVYQEQYLLLAQYFAKWDIAYADKHIRKNKNILNDTELKEKWLNDTAAYGEEQMTDLWNTICGVVAGGYSFNKSHATSYARLSFQTAYLKLYYPKEFYSAYITQNIDKPEKVNNAITELKTLGIKLLNPDINKSEDRFIPTEEGVLLPINAIKGVGGSVVHEINRMKPITSFKDFMDRRVPKYVKSTALKALIEAGAFDNIESKSRYELLCEWKEENALTAEQPNYIYEYDAFGFYLNETPFDKYSIKPMEEYADGQQVMTIGQITELKVRQDKKGNEMCFALVVNSYNVIKLVIFSSIWKNANIRENDIVFIRGKRDKESILVNTVEVVND